METLTLNPSLISHTTVQKLLQFKDGNILCYLTVQKAPPCDPENMISKARQGSFKPDIEPIEPAIKKVRSNSSLISNVDISNDMIHEAVAITECLLWCMLKTKPSFYCQKQTISNWSGFLSIVEEHSQQDM